MWSIGCVVVEILVRVFRALVTDLDSRGVTEMSVDAASTPADLKLFKMVFLLQCQSPVLKYMRTSVLCNWYQP